MTSTEADEEVARRAKLENSLVTYNWNPLKLVQKMILEICLDELSCGTNVYNSQKQLTWEAHSATISWTSRERFEISWGELKNIVESILGNILGNPLETLSWKTVG